MTWDPPAQTNGSTITGYTVLMTPQSGSPIAPQGGNPVPAGSCGNTSPACSATFASLPPGTYTLSVAPVYTINGGSPQTGMPQIRIVSIGSPTAAHVARFTAVQHGAMVSFSWRVASAKGIAGFSVFAGKHQLNAHVIPVHQSRGYVYATRWTHGGAFSLHVLLATGRQLIVPMR